MKINKKGFTLIELLIVVAIIAILAAIAIPQFSQYRLRAYNASAVSDMHSLSLQQAAMVGDWSRFARTAKAALPGAGGYGLGALVTGPGVAATPNIITTTDNGAVPTPRGIEIPTGNGVLVVASTDAAGLSYTAASQHVQGDTAYAADSDTTAIYKDTVTYKAVKITAGKEPAPVNGQDDCALVATWIKM